MEQDRLDKNFEEKEAAAQAIADELANLDKLRDDNREASKAVQEAKEAKEAAPGLGKLRNHENLYFDV